MERNRDENRRIMTVSNLWRRLIRRKVAPSPERAVDGRGPMRCGTPYIWQGAKATRIGDRVVLTKPDSTD